MHGSCEDTPEDNPQISHRSVPGTHNSTEDRTRSCNVEELNHEDFPTRQYHKVDPIGFGHCRRRAVIRTEHMRHKLSIKKVTQYKGDQTNNETDHFSFIA